MDSLALPFTPLYVIGAVAIKLKALDRLLAKPYIKSKFVRETYSDR
jgi:hypothetical protein